MAVGLHHQHVESFIRCDRENGGLNLGAGGWQIDESRRQPDTCQCLVSFSGDASGGAFSVPLIEIATSGISLGEKWLGIPDSAGGKAASVPADADSFGLEASRKM